MQNQNQTNPILPTTPPLMSDDTVVTPEMPEVPETPTPEVAAPAAADAPAAAAGSSPTSIMKEVEEKIKTVHNILIALSSDPSVDEIATAIALSLCLDRAGKRATAIYSGTTPNALQFLRPERAFETNSSVLKDFVIALNKEKADHLRYKLDGDYVKIFITPYKSSISESDFEFSLGDFNIELVLALNVPSGIDLDDALREHGRVMHDATVINITNGNPGKFGDTEWSDKTKSSIAEMVAGLLYDMGGPKSIEPEEATALLTGIVAATDHFTNNMTTANALQMAASLIRSGADRKLITENIGLDSENMFFLGTSQDSAKAKEDGSIKIDHDAEEGAQDRSDSSSPATKSTEPAEATAEPTGPTTEPATEEPTSPDSEDSTLLADLQAAAEGLKSTTEVITPSVDETTSDSKPEIALAPSDDFMAEPTIDSNNDYGQMLEAALSEVSAPATPTSSIVSEPDDQPAPEAPVAPEAPDVSAAPADGPAPLAPEFSTISTASLAPEIADTPEATVIPGAATTVEAVAPQPSPAATTESPATPASASDFAIPNMSNPAANIAPAVPATPEINGVPDINYASAPNDDVLPPPPAPPIDPSAMMPDAMPPSSAGQMPPSATPTFNA